MTSTKSRKTAPRQCSTHSDDMPFRVWCDARSYAEDATPWKCVAAFGYLLDCLDFIAALQDRGVDVVFQSPADTKAIQAKDRRVVYKPEGVAS